MSVEIVENRGQVYRHRQNPERMVRLVSVIDKVHYIVINADGTGTQWGIDCFHKAFLPWARLPGQGIPEAFMDVIDFNVRGHVA